MGQFRGEFEFSSSYPKVRCLSTGLCGFPMHIERLAHCLALAEAMSQSHCYHLLACAGQLTHPGTDTGEPFPGDPVWAGLSVTREMSSVILPLAHPLSLNLLSLSLSLHACILSCSVVSNSLDPMDHNPPGSSVHGFSR